MKPDSVTFYSDVIENDRDFCSTGPLTTASGWVDGTFGLVPCWLTGERTPRGHPIVQFKPLLIPPDAYGIVHLAKKILFAFALSWENCLDFCERARELGDDWKFDNTHPPVGEQRERISAFNTRMAEEGLLYNGEKVL